MLLSTSDGSVRLKLQLPTGPEARGATPDLEVEVGKLVLMPSGSCAARRERMTHSLHKWLHDERSAPPTMALTCVPPVGLEPTALGLGIARPVRA